MPGTADLKDLAAISRFAAGDLLLTQGAGGNTSVKYRLSPSGATEGGARLLIKASGLRLADVSETGGYLDLDSAALCTIMDDPALAELEPIIAHERTAQQMRALAAGVGSLRPSMETGFHLLLERVVLHTHPVYLNAFTCSQDGRAAFEDAAGVAVAWVPYATPGYPLAKVVAESCVEFRAAHGRPPGRIVLENHGLITTAKEAARATFDTRSLTSCGEHVFGALATDSCDLVEPLADAVRWSERLSRTLAAIGHSAIVRPARLQAVVAAAHGPEPQTRGPLMPDDAVYGVHNLWRLTGDESPVDWAEARAGELPEKGVLELPGTGVLLIGPNARTLDFMEENLLANVLVHRLIARRGQPRHLRPRQVGEILGLESEQYRQALAGRRTVGRKTAGGE